MSDDRTKAANLSPAKQALLERMRKRAAPAITPRIRPRGNCGSAPLSFAQQRMWLIQQLDPESYLYNVPRALLLRGTLDIPALEAALNAIVQRHAILRTTFPADESGQARQAIAAESKLKLAATDLSSTRPDERHAATEKHVLQLSRPPFDLVNGPLLRAHLLRFAEDEHVLALTMHHIISDGWTGGIFFRELGESYGAQMRGESASLPELAVQYADYAVWQHEWMQGAVLEKELEFWSEQLEGAPSAIALPTDRTRPETMNYQGSHRSKAMSAALTTQLKAFCQAEATTLFPLLLAGLNILLARWSGQQDQIVGTVSANRDQAEIEHLIGCFMNFLPLRSRVAPEESVIEFLRRTRQSVFKSLAHQTCPFEKIVEAVKPQRSLSANPLYNVALLVQNYPEMVFRSHQLEARLLQMDYGVAFLDLRFVAEETNGQLTIDCEYNEDLFDSGTIENLLKMYVLILERFVTSPQTRIQDIPLFPELMEQSAAASKRELVQTIAIAATFTAEPLEAPLAFWMKELGLRAKTRFALYNQVFQQLLDPASMVARNSDGFNIVLLRLSDWQGFDEKQTIHAAQNRIEASAREFITALQTAGHRAHSPFWLCICPSERKLTTDANWAEFLSRTEQTLLSAMSGLPGVHVIPSGEAFTLYPVEEYEDEYSDKLGHIPYTPAFFTALGTTLARRMFSLRTAPKQVVVLDCDNTLWQGTCAGLAPNAISVDAPRRALQEFLLHQSETGKLLCLCSKSAEADVNAVFAQNPNMTLRPEHILTQRLGVKSIPSGLRELADELQFGLNSFIFLSSSEQECAKARTECPEVLSLTLPGNSEEIPRFLNSVWAFDQASGSTGAPQIANQNQTVNRIASKLYDIASISRAMEAGRSNPRNQRFVAPRTPVEEMIAGAWAQILKLNRVGVHDNFFELGGHSVLATQIVARVRRTLGVELPLRAMFEAPTVATLAQRVEAAQRSGGELLAPQIKRSGKRDRLPLSFAQQRLWFLDQLDPGSPSYNMPRVLRMRGKLDVPALHRAINKIVERHATLRTSFALDGSEPIQVIANQMELSLPVTDLTYLSEPQREAQARTLAEQEAQHPFDLSSGPLLRAQLVLLGPDHSLLFFTMHHIVSDRWSMGVLAEELAAHYEAFVHGVPSPLPELAIQYCDFAVWQREWLQGEVLQKQLDYWKEQLAAVPAILELPTDHPRPPVLSVRGATRSVILSHELIETLTALSQNEGVTLFMTLLAAFQTLLSRYSGQEDIVVGSPIANRSFAEIEPLIGFFVNTLALRGDLSGDPTFRELVTRTKEVCLRAYAHQDVPFERLVEELQPERSQSHSPIFQVMFALQNAPMRAMELTGVALERVPVHTNTSMFDMSWFVNEVPQGFQLHVEYATDLFDEATIARGITHFKTLLESCVANPDRRISQLKMIGQGERHKVLVGFNETATVFPRSCIHNLFELSAQRTPDATALICGAKRTSYRELNQRANQVAHYLRKRGVSQETLVGICVERSSDLLVGIFGILKAGGAYVPLDPAYPKDRLGYILEDSGTSLVLTQQSLIADLPSCHAQLISLDSDWSQIARESTDDLPKQAQPENLAYVLFTSGSTGRPKGVALEHRSAATFVQWAQTVFAPQELAGTLFCTSMCFDLSVFEMFVPLSVGGKVIMAQDALHLPTLPAKDEVTLINTVPSAIAELLRSGGVPDSVKVVNLAGEALPSALVEQIYSSTSAAKVFNLYGPTEDTTYSTYTLVARGAAVTIGKPLTGTQAYILDKHKNPVPIGVPGELHLAGGGLARGYFGRTDLTAERFVPNPFSDIRDARMYCTGDLCRWLPDGNIDYLGRIDHQVKLRGFRIELGEIEAVLAKDPSVRQCLVLAREDQTGLKRLVAYLVPQKGVDPNPDNLVLHLQRSLPDFMVPTAFVVLASFPLTPNGKIDCKALPAPEYKRDAGENYVAPRNNIEEKVAAIWAEVLHLDQVSVTSDFFTLGGHSLLAAQVISRLRQAFKVELPLKAMFESPKLEILAARIQAAKHGSDVPPITRISREKPLPASSAQQRIWFLDQLEPGNPAYNIPWTLKITGAVNADAIETSLNIIAGRHEGLRTAFSTVADQPFQVIHDSVRVPFRRVDVSTLPEHERDKEAMCVIGEDANRPFDLTQAPLMRCVLVRVSDEDSYLLLNVHHIVSDRWSMGVLSQELANLYEATIEGKAADLPLLPLQYADYSEWQRECLRGPVLEKQLSYWTEKLKDIPPVLELPTDRPRQATENSRGEVAYMTLPLALTDQLTQLGRKHGATLFMTLLAGFQALLSRHSGQDDIVVGTAIANRTHPDLERVIGFFLNTLPLRTRLSGDPSFTEMIERAKATALGAYANQDMPFEKLVEELNPERSLRHSPLVQAFFVLQNAPVEALQLKGLSLKPVPSGFKTVKGDLYLSMHDTQKGLESRLEYSVDLFDPATMERLLQHFRVLLEAAVANPELKLSHLPLLTQAERQQLVVEYNYTAADFPLGQTLPHLFSAQVARTPQAIAVQFGAEQLTFAELDARSNQLARYLQERGAGRETHVALCLDRSLELVVALLAVLKAGAAYLPLDPGYPKDRIAFIVQDARVPLLVTQSSLLCNLPVSPAESNTQVLSLDAEWTQIAKLSCEPLASYPAPKDAAYLLYTSGSTGQPKGVEIEHLALTNFLLSMQREPGLESHDTLLGVTTLSFDIAGLEIYLPLITGARLLLASREQAGDAHQLSTLLEQSAATVMQATPATWRMLVDSGWMGRPGFKILCGGEALPADLANSLRTRCDSLWNMYGPTETTIWSSVYRITSDMDAVAPIGRPIANTQFYVLDANRQLTPPGVPGELYIGGLGLARGYFHRPELTAEKFVADPLSAANSSRSTSLTRSFGDTHRLYRTGDLARWQADGQMRYIGRIDNQVKLRGFRIELGEIETALQQHCSVQQCLVMAREDTPGQPRLVAYWTLVSGSQLSPAEARLHLKKSLPDYMIPSAFVEMDAMPLTPNGKVDRKRLQAPDYGVGVAAKPAEGLLTPTEEVITGIWAEVLKLTQIGTTDDFFELGGHSLLATQVISRVRQAFRTDLPVRTLFEASTIAGLALRVDASVRQRRGLATPPMRRIPRDKPLPVSFSQQRLWFLDQLEPGNPLYNIAYVTRMSGKLNSQALEKSLGEIVRRHESLRTRFQMHNDEPVQIVVPQIELRWTHLDASPFPTIAERESEARRLATEEIQKPFNLVTGPLLRPVLIKIGEEDHALILNMHHIISDRWSLGVLSQELAALYEAHLGGRPVLLPDLDFQYADYAAWQREFLSGEVLDKQLAYWRLQLEGAPPVLELPTDRPRKETGQFWGAIHRQPIPEILVKSLKDLSRTQRGTFFMTLLAAFQLFLGRLSGQEDVVIGTDLANRNQMEAEKMIGFFVNLLPMRARFNRDTTFIEFFQQVREGSLESMAHQDIPFDKLIEELRPDRSLTHNPLVQILFVMLNTPQLATGFGGLKLGPLGVGSSSRFDLVLFINTPEANPTTMWVYNPNLFDASTVARMANSYELLLDLISGNPEGTIAYLFAKLDEAEQQQRNREQEEFQKASQEKLHKIRRKIIEA